MTKSRGILPPRQRWTDEQLEMLRSEYPNTLTRDLVAKLGHPETSIHGKAKQLGVRKSAAFLSGPMGMQLDGHRDNGRRFQPGQKPWCAGTKGVVGVQPGCRETQFKKGVLVGRNAARFVEVGGYRINSDGYLDRKLRSDGPPQNRWERVHRLVWIAANGPVPRGYVITFRTGMRTTVLEDIVPERLECISRAEHANRNRAPPELQRIHQLRGQLTRAINRRSKDEAPHEQ